MRVAPSQEQFVRIDYAVIDCGILNLVEGKVFQTYVELRRLTWRSEDSGSRWSRKAYNEGKLAARMTLPQLAEEINRSVSTVQRCVSTLEELGWIRTEKSGDYVNLFIVGEWEEVRAGRVEYFYADLLAQKALAMMEERARQVGKTVRGLPMSERMAIYAKGCGIPTKEEGRSNMTDPGSSNMTDPNLKKEEEEIEKNCKAVGRPEGAPSPSNWAQKKRGTHPKALEAIEGVDTSKGRVDGLKKQLELIEQRVAVSEAAKAEAERVKMNATLGALQNFEGEGGGNHLQELRRLEKIWGALMKRHFPEVRVPKWKGPERGKMRRLIEAYNASDVEAAMYFMVECWKHISTSRYPFLNASAPNLGILAKFHELLVNDGVQWSYIRVPVLEYRSLRDESKHIPPSLEIAYEKTYEIQEVLKMGRFADVRRDASTTDDAEAIMRRAGLLK